MTGGSQDWPRLDQMIYDPRQRDVITTIHLLITQAKGWQ